MVKNGIRIEIFARIESVENASQIPAAIINTGQIRQEASRILFMIGIKNSPAISLEPAHVFQRIL